MVVHEFGAMKEYLEKEAVLWMPYKEVQDSLARLKELEGEVKQWEKVT